MPCVCRPNCSTPPPVRARPHSLKTLRSLEIFRFVDMRFVAYCVEFCIDEIYTLTPAKNLCISKLSV